MAARRGAAARRKATERTEDFYREVADDLAARIEEGTAPWTQPWLPGERSLPANVGTGRPYRGGNSVWLASTAGRRGWTDHRWGTYKQVRELGGQVRRGERGVTILYWKFESRRPARDKAGKPLLGADGKPVYETRPLERPYGFTFTVFNAEQCDGLPARQPTDPARAWDPLERAERVLSGSGAVIEHAGSDRAYFDLRRDRIVLPFREQFPDGPRYYQTALHELGHWSGHPDRLNRETLVQGIQEGCASPTYAREELRAEISSMITGERLELGHDPNRCAAYVGHWIQALKDDPREIYRAAKDAQDISDWVLERARERDPERTAVTPPAPQNEPEPPPPPLPPEPDRGEQYRMFQRGR